MPQAEALLARGRRAERRQARRDPGRRRRTACHDELIEVAELLGAGIAKALLGKAVVPDDLPFVTGSIGLLGTQPSWELMTGATPC